MVLVDTSVLIDYLKEIKNLSTEKFEHILSMEIPYRINSLIYQELLQGTGSEKDFATLKEYLDTIDFYDFKDKRDSYSEAAKIYFKCRKAGFTIRSTIDCLIAQCAIENEIFLLHNDSDYDHISKVIKKLKVY